MNEATDILTLEDIKKPVCFLANSTAPPKMTEMFQSKIEFYREENIKPLI